MTTLYLIRHAEGEGNARGVFQGLSDWKLSETGRRQLDFLAERCRELRFDALYSSPLTRAMETAMAVGRAHELPILIEPGIREIDGGDFDGRAWDEIASLYPEGLHLWKNELWNFRAPDGESICEVYERVWEAILRIARANPKRTVAVVGHGCAIKNTLCHAFGWPVERILDVPWTDNTSINRIDFDEEMNPSVVFVNDVAHLPEGTVHRMWKAWDRVGAEEITV